MFTKGLEGNYQNFGFNYWFMIIVTFLLIAIVISKKDFFKQFKYEKWIRYSVAIALLIGLASEQIWNFYNGKYDLGTSLPLSLCSFSALLSVWTLLNKSKFSFDVLFFTGIGGALLAIFHADIKYDFPHITFINFYEKHIFVVLVPIYMMAVHSFSPTIRSFKRMLLILFSLLPLVISLNVVTDGNYWFLMQPEAGEEYLQFLWEPPLKFIGIVVIMTGYFFILLKFWLLLNKKIMASSQIESHDRRDN